MYVPKQFTMKQSIREFVQQHGFANFITSQSDDLMATHTPLFLSEDEKFLIGHIAKANPQSRMLKGVKGLAIFNGPHAFITPDWYETSEAVPTWNYEAVHIHGIVQPLSEEDLKKAVISLTKNYTNPNGNYSIENVSEPYIDAQLKGIVGFQIEINKIEAIEKLSQHHPDQRNQNVANGLRERNQGDDQIIARKMEK